MARTMDAITIAGTAPAVARRRHATAHPAAALFPLRRPIVPGTRRCLAGLAACLGRCCCLRRSHCRGAGFVGAGRADAKCCVGQHDYPLTLRPPKRSRGCLAKLCASQRCGGDCIRRGGRNRPCSIRIFGQPGQFPLERRVLYKLNIKLGPAAGPILGGCRPRSWTYHLVAFYAEERRR